MFSRSKTQKKSGDTVKTTKRDICKPKLEVTPERPSTESRRVSLYAIQHKDHCGRLITDPDRSNPTRHRHERPLDTIRAFEASAEETFTLRQYALLNRSKRPRDIPRLNRPASVVHDRRSAAVDFRPRSFIAVRSHDSSTYDGAYGRRTPRLHESRQPSSDSRQMPPVNEPIRGIASGSESQHPKASSSTDFENNANEDSNAAKSTSGLETDAPEYAAAALLSPQQSTRHQAAETAPAAASGSPMDLAINQEHPGCFPVLEQQTPNSAGATSPIESVSDGETSQPTSITTPSSEDPERPRTTVAVTSHNTATTPINATPGPSSSAKDDSVPAGGTKPSVKAEQVVSSVPPAEKKKHRWFGLTMVRSLNKRIRKSAV